MDPIIQKIEEFSKDTERIALFNGERRYSFAEVARVSADIGGQLLNEAGASPNVVIIADNNASAVTSILGAIRAGATYSFLEPTRSNEFITQILQAQQPQLILCSEEDQKQIRDLVKTNYKLKTIEEFSVPISHQESRGLDQAPATLIAFTSGSTGKPKGVVIPHQANIKRVVEHSINPVVSSRDRIACSGSLSFMSTFSVLLVSLYRGATAVFLPLAGRSPEQVAGEIQEGEISVLTLTTAFFGVFGEYLRANPAIALPSLRVVSVGGERIPEAMFSTWAQASLLKCVIRPILGSTETSTYAYTDLRSEEDPPQELWYEQFAPGTSVVIRNENGETRAANAVGEICVASEKLFETQINTDIDLLEKRIPDENAVGGWYYRTGDHGELDERGRLRVLGRIDNMVKIRGYRVDLGEINVKMRSLPRVNHAICLARTNKRGEKFLAGYVEFKPDQRCSVPTIKSELLEVLDPFKIPTRFSTLSRMPFSPTGKIAVNELDGLETHRPELDTPYTPPINDLQRQLAEIWAEVLDIDRVGIEDNFFELGGDSISVLEMMQLVENKLGIKLSIDFIEEPTIHAITVQHSFPEAKKIRSDIEHYSIAKEKRLRHFREKYKYDPLTRLIAEILPHFSFSRVFGVIRWMSGLNFLQFIYTFRGREWYDRWLDEFENADRAMFRKKVVFTELSAKINRGLRIKLDHDNYDLARVTDHGWHKYYYTLLRSILDHPQRQSLPDFPVKGLEYALNALDGNAPVVFVGFHSTVYFDTRTMFQYQCGVDRIEVITKNRGIHGKYGVDGETNDMNDQALSNAGVTMHALDMVNKGIPIAFYSDTIDPLTKNYSASILGREYSIKGGFAEIAEAIGGTIIPTSVYITDGLKIGREFFPPLVTDKTDPTERIEDLVTQYALFMERVFKQEPSTKNLNKIKNHYKFKKTITGKKVL